MKRTISSRLALSASLGLTLAAGACATRSDVAEPTATTSSAFAVVTNGAFTNVYVYHRNTPTETWEEHMAALRPSDASQFSRASIDAVTDRIMTPGWPSYFDSLYQYSGINPPKFFGSSVASEACVEAALADANNGVVEMTTLRSLSNCHASGMDPSPQLNLILAPDFVIGNIAYAGPANGPDVCTQGAAAWHTGGLNSPNFSAVPTRFGCAPSFDTFTNSLTHEMVEMLSDPGWAGFGGGMFGKDEVADLCQTSSDSVTWVQGYDLARYWSNADNDCQPRLDAPSGSTSTTWVLGQQSPLQRFSGATNLTLAVPPGRELTDALATQVSLVVQTGADDLQSSSAVNVTLNLADGASFTANVSAGHHWNNGETNSALLTLPSSGVRVGDVVGVTLSSRMASGDSWNVDKVALVVSFASGSVITSPAPLRVDSWLDAHDAPLTRFTGSVHQLTLPVAPADVGQPVQSLSLVISTGNDNLNGGSNAGDNCDVQLTLASGVVISLPNVNQGQTWAGWTTNAISIPIPAGLRGGDVTAVSLQTNFGGGAFGDNWDVERVQLLATMAPPPPPPPAPVTITSLSAPSGQNGQALTIYGTGFSTAFYGTSFTFGNVPAAPVAYCASTTSCTVTVPAGTAGTTVDVTATVNGFTTTPTTADRFAYAEPIITGLSPTSGPSAGGTIVDIHGAGLTNGMTIYFGWVPVTLTCDAYGCQYGAEAVAPPGAIDSSVEVLTSLADINTSPTAPRFTYEDAIANLTLSEGTVFSGEDAMGTVTLGFPAPAGGVEVLLTSSSPAIVPVPASVTVPTGSTWASFWFTPAAAIAQPGGSVSITASTGGTSMSASVVVDAVQTVTLLSPLWSGQTATGAVTLNEPAVTSTVVTLSATDRPTSGAAATFSLPASVTIPAGQTSATFPLTVTTTNPANLVTVTATLNGTPASYSAQVFLGQIYFPPQEQYQYVAGGPASSNLGTETFYLRSPAPAGGALVTLACNSTILAVPASVTVPSGATSGSFDATGPTPEAGRSELGVVTATYAGSSATLEIGASTPKAAIGGGGGTGKGCGGRICQ